MKIFPKDPNLLFCLNPGHRRRSFSEYYENIIVKTDTDQVINFIQKRILPHLTIYMTKKCFFFRENENNFMRQQKNIVKWYFPF